MGGAGQEVEVVMEVEVEAQVEVEMDWGDGRRGGGQEGSWSIHGHGALITHVQY